jgi:hypothetical protein
MWAGRIPVQGALRCWVHAWASAAKGTTAMARADVGAAPMAWQSPRACCAATRPKTYGSDSDARKKSTVCTAEARASKQTLFRVEIARESAALFVLPEFSVCTLLTKLAYLHCVLGQKALPVSVRRLICCRTSVQQSC